MSNIRENSIVRLQEKFPHWSRQQCEAQADELIAEVLSDREPTNESEFKQKVKRKAGIK